MIEKVKVIVLKTHEPVWMGRQMHDGVSQVGTPTGYLSKLEIYFHPQMGVITIKAPEPDCPITWVPLSNVKQFRTLLESSAEPSSKASDSKK
jgi:hypothetical protein